MALKAKYTGNGWQNNNAYFKIVRISGSKEDGLTGQVFIYTDKAARDAGGNKDSDINVNCSWDGTGNPYNLLYNALKLIYTDGADI